MNGIQVISVVLIVGLAWASAFFQLSAIVWSILIAVTLLTISLFGILPAGFLFICWILFLLAAAFANLNAFRELYIISPSLDFLKKKIPSISLTEREAIEAGNTWWEKELFCGRPKWKQLFEMGKPTLTEEESAFLNNQVEHVCAMINDWEIINDNQDLSPAVWDYLKREKFFGMVIPKKYGGLGFSALMHSTVVTQMATRSVSAAVNTMVPNSLGPAELLLHYGTEDQKAHYLPRLAQGTDIPCFALTAPDAGSDAGAMPDTGVICKGDYQGKEVLGIMLNWDKRYITLAPVATVLGLAFRLFDPDHLIGDQLDVGITLCLIPTNHPGVEIGDRHIPLYLAFMNGPTRGKDVFIPLDWIIGGPKMAGLGWRMLMECLSIGRSISLPALATACGKMAYRFTGAYSRIRRQFNTPISTFEGIEEPLGYIAGYTYLMDATRQMTAFAVDSKIKPSIASAIAKYHMTELSRSVISHALDIHSGHMIQVGPKNFLANVYMAIPISITVEGANILTRNLIVFGQGSIRCHPYLLKEIELITASDPSIKALDQVLMSHIGFFVSNLVRSFSYGLTGGKLIRASMQDKKIRTLQRQLTRMSTALALLSDTSLILLGGSLKRRESISARLGDILSQLYLASATLKYFKDHQCPESDVNYVLWVLHECLYKIQIACDQLFHNYPNKWVGRILSFIVFPFGRAYQRPKDALFKKIIQAMLAPSELRNRLTKYCYISDKPDEISYLLDAGLAQIDAIDPILKKMYKAIQNKIIPFQFSSAKRIQSAQEIGILTSEEAHALKQFELLRQEIIKVNEFTFQLDQVLA